MASGKRHVTRKGGTYFELIGDEEHIAMFKQLPESVQRRSIRAGCKAGAMLLRKKTIAEIDARTRQRTGRLRKSVAWEDITKLAKGLIAARVFFGRSKGRMGHHAMLVEFGHRIVSRGPDKGAVPTKTTGAKKRRKQKEPKKQLRNGMVKGRGFFRAAIGKSWPAVKAEMQDGYVKQLKKEVAKVQRKIDARIHAARRAA